MDKDAERRGWRWTSTPLSADRGEISVLAIIETIAAVSISLGIAWHYQTLIHIAVSACLAPLVLLKTKRSVALGLRLFFRYRNYYLFSNNSAIISLCIFLTASGLSPLMIRICSIIESVLKSPIRTISQITRNWQIAVYCMDVCYPPELIPGIERRKKQSFYSIRRFGYDMLLAAWHHSAISFSYFDVFLSFSRVSLLLPTLLLFMPFMYLPSIMFRWSVKSTFIIWSPLVWTIATAKTIGPVRFRLYDIRNGAMYKIMRLYSLFVLSAFAWKVTLLFGWAQVSALITDAKVAELVTPYVAPSQLPLWQVAAAVSALLAWGVYFLADTHLRAIEVDNPRRASETTIKRQITAMTMVRNTLAIYTAVCTLYITWQVASGIEWPTVELVLFPWGE